MNHNLLILKQIYFMCHKMGRNFEIRGYQCQFVNLSWILVEIKQAQILGIILIIAVHVWIPLLYLVMYCREKL